MPGRISDFGILHFLSVVVGCFFPHRLLVFVVSFPFQSAPVLFSWHSWMYFYVQTTVPQTLKPLFPLELLFSSLVSVFSKRSIPLSHPQPSSCQTSGYPGHQSLSQRLALIIQSPFPLIAELFRVLPNCKLPPYLWQHHVTDYVYIQVGYPSVHLLALVGQLQDHIPTANDGSKEYKIAKGIRFLKYHNCPAFWLLVPSNLLWLETSCWIRLTFHTWSNKIKSLRWSKFAMHLAGNIANSAFVLSRFLFIMGTFIIHLLGTCQSHLTKYPDDTQIFKLINSGVLFF